MLLTEDYYQRITGDTATPTEAFATAASAAQDLLEDALGVPGFLESGERTESLPICDGVVYPTATPVTVAEGYTVVDGNTLYGVTPDLPAWLGTLDTPHAARADVTYTGGWTADTAPGYMRRDLAFVAWAILRPATVLSLGAIAGNPTSARVGDVAVTYGANGAAPDGLAVVGVDWSYYTMRHRAIEP